MKPRPARFDDHGEGSSSFIRIPFVSSFSQLPPDEVQDPKRHCGHCWARWGIFKKLNCIPWLDLKACNGTIEDTLSVVISPKTYTKQSDFSESSSPNSDFRLSSRWHLVETHSQASSYPQTRWNYISNHLPLHPFLQYTSSHTINPIITINTLLHSPIHKISITL